VQHCIKVQENVKFQLFHSDSQEGASLQC